MSRPQPALTAAAHADVLLAAQHYNAQAPLLGLEFLDEFEQTLSLIQAAPLLFTLVEPPVRRALVHRFPYGVFYLPGSEFEADIVVAVVELHQHPDVIRRAYRR